jgi:hypothetical protein
MMVLMMTCWISSMTYPKRLRILKRCDINPKNCLKKANQKKIR